MHVDDGAVAVEIDLKQCLIRYQEIRPRPLNNGTKINKTKTKIMNFTKSRKFDFPPELTFSDGKEILCSRETKLVGVILTENLSWQRNTDYICQKARQKLWILRRITKLGLKTESLLDVYAKEVRSILELAVPVWHSGLTKKQSLDIERIQKISFRLILGEEYSTYQQACKLLSAETLEQRRTKLCLKFAKKNFQSDYCLFIKNTNKTNTRQKPSVVSEYKCRTKRFQNSSLPYLAKLLNKMNK